MTNTLLSLAAFGIYLVAAGLLIRRLAQGQGASDAVRRTAIGIGLIGAAVHTVVLHQNVFLPGGLSLGFFNVMSLVAWLAALLLALSSLTRPTETLGIIIYPLAAAALLLNLIFPSAGVLDTRGTALEFHILFSFLAYSLLAIAAAQALLLAVQEGHLRNKHPGGFIRALPPLQTMESLLFQLIGLGFLLLTIALLTGLLFLEDIFAQHLVHKTVLSVTAWLVFATLLLGRWRFGWRGRTAIRWTLGGFIVLMLAYFGSKLVLEVILGR